MSTIFELFGHGLNDNSLEAQQDRANAWCPFMALPCDGGGNRYQSNINLKEHSELQAIYPNMKELTAGVCSLRVRADESPWIVCPRRLLVLGREAIGTRKYQSHLERQALSLLSYPSGTKLGVWTEVKVEYEGERDGIDKSFDYTFDYILMPVSSVNFLDLASKFIESEKLTNKRSLKSFQDLLRRVGYILNAEDMIEDFPIGSPSIIEIMTSSTSGGNKKKRTTIPQSFEDAILGKPHNGPGINYRQVWARMVSQLLVKSEVAIGWGGRCVWVVQDVLVDYISASTGINIRRFVSTHTDDVNMLSFSYDLSDRSDSQNIIDLPHVKLYSGAIAPEEAFAEGTNSFLDIVRSPIQPPLDKLLQVLINKGPAHNYVVMP